jgi:SAM-dependent methyltransferase
MSDLFYRAFEDQHRGSRDVIKARLRAYEPFLLPLRTVLNAPPTALDLGCGRGEWLELLTEHGFDAQGVDLDEGMLAACRERGLRVQTQDALSGLRAQPDASLALVSAFHLIEHIPFDDVQVLITEALRALRPGGLLIMETPNPENLVVATSGFYMDPSHLRPIPPMLLEFVVGFHGFPRHKVLRLQEPAALHGPVTLELINLLNGVSPDFSVLAQKAAPAPVLAAFDAAFAMPFGIELAALSARYQHQQQENRAALQADMARLDGRVAAVETGTVSLFDRALSVVGQANEAMHTVQLDLATSLQRERSIADASRALEKQIQTLTGEASAFERQVQTLTDEANALTRSLEQALAAIAGAEERAAQADKQALAAIAGAEERATQADKMMELVSQAQHVEWERNVALVRASNAEHAVGLIYASTSWRLTAPFRLVSGGVKRILRALALPKLRIRTTRALRPLAAKMVRKIMGHGRLARIGMAFLARHPGLKARLRRLVGSPHGTPAADTFTAPSVATHGDGTSNITPRAARLLADLQKAAAEKRH